MIIFPIPAYNSRNTCYYIHIRTDLSSFKIIAAKLNRTIKTHNENKTSYGIIETIRGFVMARNYIYIQQYVKEILILKADLEKTKRNYQPQCIS